MWTARRDLPSGTVVQEGDLAPSAYSPDTVPADAVDDVDRVLGRTLAAPMSRGEVFTETRTVTGGLLRGYPGATAVPLRVTDAAVVDLLRVGDRVSFVVADPDGRSTPTLLLRDVPLVAIPGRPTAGSATVRRVGSWSLQCRWTQRATSPHVRRRRFSFPSGTDSVSWWRPEQVGHGHRSHS